MLMVGDLERGVLIPGQLKTAGISPTPGGVGRNWDRVSMHPGLSQTSCVTVTSRCLSFLTGKMRRMVRESPSGT